MMSLQTKLERIRLAFELAEVLHENGVSVYHYWRPGTESRYVIWEEDGEMSSLEADGHKREQSISGTVDFYTLTEFDTMFDEIQDILNGIEGLWWSYDGTQFEEETNYIHHTWRWGLL